MLFVEIMELLVVCMKEISSRLKRGFHKGIGSNATFAFLLDKFEERY
jgi:hypothetical protein